MTRLTGSTKYSIQTEVHMRKSITSKYYLHIVPCIRERIVRSSEESQYRVKEQQTDTAKEQTNYDIEHHAIS